MTSLEVGHRIVLAAAGEIDMETAPSLPAAVDAALSRGARDVWVDLTDVTFLDSSGVHALIEARGRVGRNGCAFAVICPAGPARRTLTVSGLDGNLPLYASRDEAHRNC